MTTRVKVKEDDVKVAKLTLSTQNGKLVAVPGVCPEFTKWCIEFQVAKYKIDYEKSTNLVNKNKLGYDFFIDFESEEDAVLFNMTWGDFNAKLVA